MTLDNYEEHPDGSCTFMCDMTNEEKQLFIEIGFIKLLQDHVQTKKQGDIQNV